MAEPPPSMFQVVSDNRQQSPQPSSLSSSSHRDAGRSAEDPGNGSYPAVSGALEGYDYDFVSNPDERYRCAICLLVLREPWQTPCGHLYCRSCILKWVRGSHNRCPVDNEEISERRLFPDNFSKREVDNFQAFCPNHNEGCDAIITVKHMLDHLKVCMFALVPCPNKCTYVLRRKDLEDHLQNSCDRRLVSCTECSSNYVAVEVEAHKEVCAGARIPCPFCQQEVRRDEISRHQDYICPDTIICCPFHHLGCDKQTSRGELEDHLRLSVTHHLSLLCGGVLVLFRYLNLSPLLPLTSGPPPPPAADVTQTEVMQAVAEMLPPVSTSSLTASGTEQATLEENSFLTPPSSLRAASSSSPSSFPSSFPAYPGGTFLHPRSPLGLTVPVPQLHPHPLSLPHSLPHQPHHHHHHQSDILHPAPPPPRQRGPTPVPPPATLTVTSTATSTSSSTLEEEEEASLMTYASDPGKKPGSSDKNLSPVVPAQLSSGEQSTPSSSSSSSMTSTSMSSASLYAAAADSGGGSDRVRGSSLKSLGSSAGSTWLGDQQLIMQGQELVVMQGRIERLERSLKSKMAHHEQQLEELPGRLCQGLFYWKIHNYSRHKQEAERSGVPRALHSGPFYTHPTGGYKLCLRANLQGVDSGRGSHLSLFVHFLKGEDDEVLEWPFAGRILLSVLDQNPHCHRRHHVEETLLAQPDLAAFQRPTTPRNHKGFGYVEFLPLSALKDSTYVLNDTLIIKAHVLPNT